MVAFDRVCLPCKGGFHEECSDGFAGELADDKECCCDGEYQLADEYKQMWRAEAAETAPAPRRAPAAPVGDVPVESEPKKGDSGYIHPDAWLGTADIGTLTDPKSTGRKRVERMYPISGGQVCDWAGKKNCGGGPKPIVGCINNPASDLHHGPDKNTLNNQKVSRGIGVGENVHAICSECVTPSMRVLMRDLTWREAGDIRVGDELVAFDEAIEGSGNDARLKPATVTAVARVQEPSFRFLMANGAVLESSHRHRWVASSPARHHLKWRTTESLKALYNLRLLVEPWETRTDYWGGWLAGLFDGEGSLTRYHLSVGQNVGRVLEKARSLLLEILKGHMNVQERPAGRYEASTGTVRNSNMDFEHLRVTNLPDVLRLLGSLRPLRLLARAEEYWVGKSATAVKDNRVAIDSIEDLGTVEVVSITTTAGTLIVEGFLSHNCHNAWHAANDPFYPPYDRVEQQAEPWLPHADFPWGPGEPEAAEYDELAAEDRRRHEQSKKRGREHRGRNAKARAAGDFAVAAEDDDEHGGDPGPAEGEG